jgi:hypothetical protein
LDDKSRIFAFLAAGENFCFRRHKPQRPPPNPVARNSRDTTPDPGFLAEQQHCAAYYKGTQYDLLMYEVVSPLKFQVTIHLERVRAESEFVVPKILGTPGLGSIYSDSLVPTLLGIRGADCEAAWSHDEKGTFLGRPICVLSSKLDAD